jgi:hypothetical protein
MKTYPKVVFDAALRLGYALLVLALFVLVS